MQYRKSEIEEVFNKIVEEFQEELLLPPHEGVFSYFSFQKAVRARIIFKPMSDSDIGREDKRSEVYEKYFNEAERDYGFFLICQLIRRKSFEEICKLRGWK
jgi:hypothetical protein